MNDLFNALLSSILQKAGTLIAKLFVSRKHCSEIAFREKYGVLVNFITVNEPNVILLILFLTFHLPPQFHQHDSVEESEVLLVLAA